MPTFQAAAASADWSSAPGFGVILTEQAGAGTWPITNPTFILMHKKAAKDAESAEALKFFDWALTKGDKMASELDYVPMPQDVVTKIEAAWAQITGADGKPLFVKK
jgi:phosphate transport system substrate-binding protein